MTFSEFIVEKGVKNVALHVGISEGAVYVWCHRNAVPRDRWPELLLAYPDLELADLIEMEAHKK